MAHAHLEVFKACPFHSRNHEGNDLGVSLGAVIVHEFDTHLCAFIEASVVGMIVAVDASMIAQPERHLLLAEIHGNGAGDGGRKIRAQHQSVAVAVKEFIEIPGRRRSDFLCENVEEFKAGGFDGLIAVGTIELLDLPLQISLPVAFAAEYVTDTLGGVDQFFHGGLLSAERKLQSSFCAAVAYTDCGIK